MDPTELRAALCAPEAPFAEDAVRFAMEHKDVACATSLAILNDALAEARRGESPLGFGPRYATALLGHHRHAPAHALLVDIARAPAEVSGALFGTLTTEGLDACLWATANGETDGLRAILFDRAADAYCRGAAASALWIGVATGELAREAALEATLGYLDAAFEGDLQDLEGEELDFLDVLGMVLVQMAPVEALKTLERAVNAGVIDAGAFGLAEVYEAALVVEERRDEIRRDLLRFFPVDPKALASLPHFRELAEARDERRREHERETREQKLEAARQAKAKEKRKAQKKARKKARR